MATSLAVHAPGPHSGLSFRVEPLELILRCILAFLVGVTLHIEYFYRFLPYGRREQQLPGFWIFEAAMFFARFVSSFRTRTRRLLLAPLPMIDFVTANAVLIVSECREDPTNHNLSPFEMLEMIVLSIPVFIGPGVASRFDRGRARS